MTGVRAQIAYAAALEVTTAAPGAIREAVLMRPGAVTHAFDMEQRLVEIEIAAVLGGKLRLVGPPNANIAPAGILHAVLDQLGGGALRRHLRAAWIHCRDRPAPAKYAASARYPASASATRRIGPELLGPCGDCICAGWDHRRWS
jgi:hypothetical protein